MAEEQPLRLPGRRRAVARSRLGAGAGVRRAPAAGGVGRAGLRGARAGDGAGAERAAGAGGRGPAPTVDARALLASVIPGAAGRAGARPDRRRDARQPAGAAGAAARVDAGGAGRRLRAAGRAAAQRAGSRRASGGGWRRLPRDTRRLLLLAAAEPLGDPCWCGARPSGSGSAPTRRRPAAAAGLLELGPRVRFRHPLVRSAVYRRGARRRTPAACTARWRRPPTRALDPDRRAWHRAQAAPAPDEEVAAELERSAGRAQARGGLAAAAAFLERAAALTPDPARRARARAGRGAGQAPGRRVRRRARPAGRRREAGPLDELAARPRGPAARPDRVRTRAAAATPPRCCSRPRSGSSRSTPTSRARPTWRRCPRRCSPAASASRGRAAGGGRRPRGRRRRPRRRARARPPPRRPGAAAHRGLRRGGAAAQARAARVPRRGLPTEAGALRWLWLALHTSPSSCGTTRRWDVLATRRSQLAREAGALTVLPIALTAPHRRAPLRRRARRGHGAACEEAGGRHRGDRQRASPSYAAVLLAAWRGRRGRASRS